LLMVIVYGYYIKFHWKCICKSQEAAYHLLKTVRYSGDSLLNCSDDNESKTSHCTCNRHFVLAELLISNIELYLKDVIQCALLIVIYCMFQNDASLIIQPNGHDILFVICSIAAHFKLSICFFTKLCGLGSGEKMADCESSKCYLSVLGIFGSLASASFCIFYLVWSLDYYYI
jgi:hypothetical protein